MRRIIPLLIVSAALAWPIDAAHAQDVLYRCESADGISIQGKPCPKGVSQRKIAVQRPVETTPVPTGPAEATPAQSAARVVPLAPDSAMHGPNEPYPLWQCMRADGSTYDSRDGVAGKQWVVKPEPSDDSASGNAAPAKITNLPKGAILRPIEQTVSVASDEPKPDLTPPPPGSAPGQWVADQCVRLEPQQACARYAVRRDALRKQIYAAKPTQRATWAPEEQDLSSMLYAACGR